MSRRNSPAASNNNLAAEEAVRRSSLSLSLFFHTVKEKACTLSHARGRPLSVWVFAESTQDEAPVLQLCNPLYNY